MLPVERLKTIPLFRTLDDKVLAHLAPLFHHAHYERDDFVCRQGEKGDAFFVLERGVLRVHHVDHLDLPHVLGYLSAPAFFGETSLLNDLNRDVTMEVFSADADLAILHKAEFEDLLLQFPEAGEHFHVRSDVQRKLARNDERWLTEGELVFIYTRRHWYALARKLILPGILSGVLFLLAGLVYQMAPAGSHPFGLPNLSGVAGPILLAIATGVALLAVGWHGLNWSNDYLIVTDKRVVHVEKTLFLFEDWEEAPIEQVTNVVEICRGWWSRLLDMSDVHVETAGRRVDIDFTLAPRTLDIRQQILNQIEQARERAALAKREQVRSNIREELWQRLKPGQATEGKDPSGSFVGADYDEEYDVFETTGNTPSIRRELFRSLQRPVSASPEQIRHGRAPVILEPIRRRQETGIGRWLNDQFGLRIEEPGRVTWRKHWLVLLRRTAKAGALLFVLLGAGVIYQSGVVDVRIFDSLVQEVSLETILISTWLIALGAVLFWLWYRYEDWRNDIYRVTDDRVMDIERSPLGLKEHAVETTLDRIQDVSFVKSGILANLFNYGNLVIETAGSERMTFYDVTEPRDAVAEIFQRRDLHKIRFQQAEVQQERREFLDWFMEYHRFLEESGKIEPSDSLPPVR